jgi:hypothetical protein
LCKVLKGKKIIKTKSVQGKFSFLVFIADGMANLKNMESTKKNYAYENVKDDGEPLANENPHK